jgi:hypothetical protein
MRATNMPESNHRAAAFASQKYQLHAYKIGVGQNPINILAKSGGGSSG